MLHGLSSLFSLDVIISPNGLTEYDGHENDGPNLRVIKLQNLTTLNTLALEIHAVTLK